MIMDRAAVPPGQIRTDQLPHLRKYPRDCSHPLESLVWAGSVLVHGIAFGACFSFQDPEAQVPTRTRPGGAFTRFLLLSATVAVGAPQSRWERRSRGGSDRITDGAGYSS